MLDPDRHACNLSLGDGQFNYRQDIAIDSNASNNIYVDDSKNNRIQKFDYSGTFIRTWGSECLQHFDHAISLRKNSVTPRPLVFLFV
jgi:hypothetical protein